MQSFNWKAILGYGLLAAAVLACLRLIGHASIGLPWGRELVGAVIAVVAMLIGVKLATHPGARSAPGDESLPPALDHDPLAERDHRPADAPVARAALTARETQVLGLLCDGLSNKRIAREMGVSENTVKTHLSSVYAKLGVSSRTAALAAARRSLEQTAGTTRAH